MSELNTKIDIITLSCLIDNNIEEFKHYNVPMAEQILDVFLHTRTNNLFRPYGLKPGNLLPGYSPELELNGIFLIDISFTIL